MKKKSRWAAFKEKWQNGCDHAMCARATRVCLARGKVPCDVVFCGEAPGISEDVIGSPFVGQAGKLLDVIVAHAVPPDVRCSFTNLVGCIPREATAKKYGEPDKTQILQCADRLEEYIKLCDPKLVVCVGDLAKKWFKTHDEFNSFEVVSIIHPAALLRMNIASRPLELKKCVVILDDALSMCGLL